MEHRAVGHRQAEVHGPAAADRLSEIDGEQPPVAVHAHAVVDARVMTLAGHDEIVVPVIAHLDRPPGARGHHGAGDGEVVALALLAAEAAAHAPDLDAHGVHRQAQRIGHLVLDLGGMLRGGMHDHVAPLLRKRQCGLSLEVRNVPARRSRCGPR